MCWRWSGLVSWSTKIQSSLSVATQMPHGRARVAGPGMSPDVQRPAPLRAHRPAQRGQVERIRQPHVPEPVLTAPPGPIHDHFPRGVMSGRFLHGLVAGTGLVRQALQAAGVIDHDLHGGEAFQRQPGRPQGHAAHGRVAHRGEQAELSVDDLRGVVVEEVGRADAEEARQRGQMIPGRVVPQPLAELPQVGGGDRRPAFGTDRVRHLLVAVLTATARPYGLEQAVEFAGQGRRRRPRVARRHRHSSWCVLPAPVHPMWRTAPIARVTRSQRNRSVAGAARDCAPIPDCPGAAHGRAARPIRRRQPGPPGSTAARAVDRPSGCVRIRDIRVTLGNLMSFAAAYPVRGTATRPPRHTAAPTLSFANWGSVAPT